MHLEPGSVELPLDACRPGTGERLRDVSCGLSQHGSDRAQHLEPEAGEALGPVQQRRPRDDRKVAGEHVRPAQVGGGKPGGLRDRIDHDTGQRALPQLAAEESEQETLLRLGRGAQHGRERLSPYCPGPRSLRSRHACESRRDVEELERRR